MLCSESIAARTAIDTFAIKWIAVVTAIEYAERDSVAQLPPDAGLKPWHGACLVRSAYGLKDAPRQTTWDRTY